MAAKNKYFSPTLFAGLVSCVISCTGVPFLVPNPPVGEGTKDGVTASAGKGEEEPQKPLVVPVPVSSADVIDFSAVFGADSGTSVPTPPVESAEGVLAKTLVPATTGTFSAPNRMIRVVVRRNISRIEVSASEDVEVRSASLRAGARCSGRLLLEKKGAASITIAVNNGPLHEVVLPCSLIALHQTNLFELEGKRYRGSLVVSSWEMFSLINFIPVEDYLRGVLPPEMGKRSMEEVEALKAQAIAARTYAYKRIDGNSGRQFDVLSTIADQVYGGADVETEESNFAVDATRDLVLWWRDSLAEVYYHSTCGGRTASVSEVWGGPYKEYLCSKSDLAPDGKAYCSIAPSFNWEESWAADDLSKIVRTTIQQTVAGGRFSGTLRDIKVEERFGCGRVKSCRFTGPEGNFAYGGDKIRFILRRKTSSGEILRSANFSVEKNGPGVFLLRGKGYGHGLGMCQMGAIGRARSGQNFEQILNAYFDPARIVRIQ